MILIVGGAYQGKAAFAESLFPKIRWMDGETCDFADLYECQGILRFHAYIRRMLEKGQDVDDLAEKLMRRNPGAVVITDEIGYGIVPADAFLREYREAAGRVWPRTQKRSGGYPVELERGSRDDENLFDPPFHHRGQSTEAVYRTDRRASVQTGRKTSGRQDISPGGQGLC